MCSTRDMAEPASTALPAVLVTGGARRIGAAICRRFAAAGWHVVVHCRHSRDAAEALAAALPSAQVVAGDLAVAGVPEALCGELAARLRDWRALVNSAALFGEAADDDAAIDLYRTNALAPLTLAEAFLRHARAPDGRRVIQLTDQKIANPNPDFPHYTMTKHALAATVPLLQMAAGPADRIFALAPGAILPSLDQSETEAERSHRMNLLGRRTDACEVAEAAWLLATGPLAGGQTLFVDSGQHLLRQPRDVIFLAREGAAA